jgi:hypothetical protein
MQRSKFLPGYFLLGTKSLNEVTNILLRYFHVMANMVITKLAKFLCLSLLCSGYPMSTVYHWFL